MDGDDFFIQIVGDRRILDNMDQLPDQVRHILLDKVSVWVDKLEDAVIENITTRLNVKTGELLRSVSSEVINDGNRIDGRVYIRAPYAAAQDRGAVTPPHVIRPRNGKLLAFMAATGDKVMTTKVSHPGGTIPATRFAKDAYGAMGPQFSKGIKNAVVQGIRQNMRSGSN